MTTTGARGLHADLRAIADAVAIESPTRYALRGQPREVPAGPEPEGAAGPAPLLGALEFDLYERLYTRPTAGAGAAADDWLARRDLIAALSAANGGRGTWEPGWTVAAREPDGQVAVTKDGLTFWVGPDGLKAPGDRIEPGAPCRVRVAKELRQLMPGYYVAIGDGTGDADDGGDATEPLVRFYWHLSAGAAVPFLAATTAILNARAIPFRAKLLSHPGAYGRADAGVLYLRRRYYGRLGDAVARIHESVAAGLRPAVPLFTKRLADGLGLAEDPPAGPSFGLHRCALAARGLWRAFARGGTSCADRAAALAEVYREAGLDPRRPYLEPRSRDVYALRPAPPPRRARRPRAATEAPPAVPMS